jgi:two-component system alkaline phosphatase synthesis response regulator PhoP
MHLIEDIIDQIRALKNTVFTAEEVIKIIKTVVANDSKIVKDDDVIVDLSSYTIEINGKKSKLPRKVLQMAYYLIDNKNRVITRERLLSAIWGDDIIVGPRTIDVHIRKLRIALNNKYIKTYKGIGYMWKN